MEDLNPESPLTAEAAEELGVTDTICPTRQLAPVLMYKWLDL